jgi:hypothetical protein
MKLNGLFAELSTAEQKILGISLEDGQEYVRRLPLDEALERTQHSLQAVELDMNVTWYGPEDLVAFVGYSVIQAQLNVKLEKLTDMAAAVLVHETEQFLASRQ